jgi:hypothetical protein
VPADSTVSRRRRQRGSGDSRIMRAFVGKQPLVSGHRAASARADELADAVSRARLSCGGDIGSRWREDGGPEGTRLPWPQQRCPRLRIQRVNGLMRGQ